MKRTLLLMLLFATSVLGFAAQKTITVSTGKTDLVMQVAPNGRLYQVYLGDRLTDPSEYDKLD
uniref:hypothetical protein n=1 Tax=Prevotella sp. TaxID=59823 RepID=UPI003FF0B54D